jgi:hypothetical protein
MILSTKILVKSNKYYQKLGYNISEKYIEINIKDLPKGSHVKILAKCDYCYLEREISFKEYNKNISINGKYSCSIKCGVLKSKETNLEKYGVESTNQLDSVKEKNKKTIKEKYGVDHISQVNEIRNKKSQKMKTDSKNISDRISEFWKNLDDIKIDEINNKRKETVFNLYGDDNISKLDCIKEKIKNTVFKNWGGFTYQSKYLVDKIILTNLERYGVTFSASSEIVKEKIKKTNLEKYGFECAAKNEDVKNKTKNTIKSKYGVENIMFLDHIVKDLKNKFYDKWGVDSYFKTNEFKLSEKGNTLKNEIWRIKNLKISNDDNYIRYIGEYNSEFKCDCGEDHTFVISSINYHNRIRLNTKLCTVCFPISENSSIKEIELRNYILLIYNDDVISNYRDVFEIDIYIPKLKLGFEFNGLYWHSFEKLDKNYHYDKSKYFMEKGIRIIHVWEDDWDFKKDIVKSQIKNWIGISENKIFARKCEIREINEVSLYKNFLNQNHIQGFVRSIIKLGLFYKGELVSLMTFDKSEGRKKMNVNEWNLSRFCSKLNVNVVGGASKLLNYFIKKYSPVRITSFADKDWSQGDLYFKLGFKLIYDLKPDYKYILDNKRVNKQKFTKKKLKKMGYFNITESQATKEIGLVKIYNSGQLKFQLLLIS